MEIKQPLWNLNGGMVQLLLGNTRLYCLFNELVVVLDLLDCWGVFFLQFFNFREPSKREGVRVLERESLG